MNNEIKMAPIRICNLKFMGAKIKMTKEITTEKMTTEQTTRPPPNYPKIQISTNDISHKYQDKKNATSDIYIMGK